MMPKLPAYGDSSKLEQLASGTKQQNGTFGPLVQKQGPGRPPVAQPQNPTGPSRGQTPVLDEHKQMYSQVAQAEKVRLYWQYANEMFPDATTEYYLAQAEAAVEAIANNTYSATPNFEF